VKQEVGAPAAAAVDVDGLQYLATARALAKGYGLAEIAFTPASRVVSFAGTAQSGQARWNVYYTTRTVGTCLEHPRQGKTQMFRRLVSPQQLQEVFADPRVHTGKGYQTVSDIPASPTGQPPPGKARRLNEVAEGSPGPESSLEEEQAIEALLAEAEHVVVELRMWRDQLRLARLVRAAQLKAAAEERARVAAIEAEAAAKERARVSAIEAEAAAKERARVAAAEAAAEAARVNAQAKAAAEAARVNAEAERKRRRGTLGDFMLSEMERNVSQDPDDPYDPDWASDASFALGSTWGSAVRLYAWGGWSYNNVPTGLENALKGRSVNLPSPCYVQLDWSSGWILVFENGQTKWGSLPSSFCDAFNESQSSMRFCAFGEPGSWYIQFKDGSEEWAGLSDDQATKIRAGGVAFLSLGPQNEMLIRYDTHPGGRKFAWSNGPDGAMREVNKLHGRGFDVRSVHFGRNDQYIIRYSHF
jgi:hypothetical protein